MRSIGFCTADSRLRLQEALADSFEAMNLMADALVQYDELEVSFFQALKGECRLRGGRDFSLTRIACRRAQHGVVWQGRRIGARRRRSPPPIDNQQALPQAHPVQRHLYL